ncbi:MAG: hypothetical protein GEU73_15685 [Chloroflexi bacterium]|nr:hypothetical protein [Chloroflexota bacterium]
MSSKERAAPANSQPAATPRWIRWAWSPGALILLFVLTVATETALTPSGRSGVTSALLIPHFFPGSVPRPLQLVTPPPSVSTIEVPGAPGRMIADIYRPGDGGRFPAIVLLLGVNPLPRDHEQVTTLADGIARSGIVTVVAESDALKAGEIRIEEVDNLVALFTYLERDPGVDSSRIGFAGFCIGGVLQLLAASDPRIADRVAVVNAFSFYADSLDVMRAILTERMPTTSGSEPWTPNPLTREVFFRHILAPLPSEEDRTLLHREVLEAAALTAADVDSLSPLGRHVRELLRAKEPWEVDALISSLPDEYVDQLRRFSPADSAHRLQARTFLMHDVNDAYLPVSGARTLADALPSAALERYTEFQLFAHVVPDQTENPLLFAGEIVSLFSHIHAVLQAIDAGRPTAEMAGSE